MSEEVKNKRKEVLCMGGVVDSSSTLKIRFCPVVEGVPLTSRSFMFKKSKATDLIVGGVYEVEVTSEVEGEIKSVNFSECHFSHRIQGNLLTSILLSDKQARTATTAMKKAKDDNVTKMLDRQLEPIRNVMRGTNHEGKAALLALVIQRLTK